MQASLQSSYAKLLHNLRNFFFKLYQFNFIIFLLKHYLENRNLQPSFSKFILQNAEWRLNLLKFKTCNKKKISHTNTILNDLFKKFLHFIFWVSFNKVLTVFAVLTVKFKK